MNVDPKRTGAHQRRLLRMNACDLQPGEPLKPISDEDMQELARIGRELLDSRGDQTVTDEDREHAEDLVNEPWWDDDEA